MKNATPEQQIKNSILEYLRIKKIFAWPVDSIGIYDPVKKIYRKKNSKFHMNGVADILGIFNGKPLAIEVKAPKGRVSDEQRAFLTMFRAVGGIGIVARSIDDVEGQLRDWEWTGAHTKGIL